MLARPDPAAAPAPSAADAPVPVYFVAESTGISAEAMGNALLVQFPGVRFERKRIPFITSLGDARKAVATLDAAMAGPHVPLVFATIADDTIRGVLGTSKAPQLTLGLDRDSALVAAGFDERDPAVKHMLALAISAAKRRQKYVGICGQGPSDHPDLAVWLLEQGIDTMSLNPDTVVETWTALAKQ
jgi:signal transduction protein with GAF and PtsI domain